MKTLLIATATAGVIISICMIIGLTAAAQVTSALMVVGIPVTVFLSNEVAL